MKETNAFSMNKTFKLIIKKDNKERNQLRYQGKSDKERRSSKLTMCKDQYHPIFQLSMSREQSLR